MIVSFIGGAQGKVSQQQTNFKTNNSVRVAHTKSKKTKNRVGDRPHSTFIYEAAFEFRLTLPSSATEERRLVRGSRRGLFEHAVRVPQPPGQLTIRHEVTYCGVD